MQRMLPKMTSADDGASNPHVAKVREMAAEEGAKVFVICAQIEQELAELSEDEKKEYLDDLGVESSGLDKLVAASYSILGLISFLTAARTSAVHGRSRREPRHRRQPARFIRTSREALSRRRLSTTRIFWTTEASLQRVKKALSEWKARIMW